VSVTLNSPFFGFDPNEQRMMIWYGSDSLKIQVLFLIIWMMFTVPIGGIICNNFLLKSGIKSLMIKYRMGKFMLPNGMNEFVLFKFILILGLVSTFLIWGWLPETNPLSVLLNGGNVIEAQIIRRDFVLGSGNRLLDMIINDQLIQMCCFMSLAGYNIYNFRRWKYAYIFFFIASIFFSISSGSTGRLIYFFLGIAFMRSMVTGVFFKFKELFIFILFLVIMFIYFKGASGSVSSIVKNDITSRIFLTQNFGFYAALTIFPNLHPHLYFSSTGKVIHDIFNIEFSEDYGRIMMNFTNYEGVIQGQAGHVTTIFMGEAWANFGIIGVLLAPLWVGFFVQFVNIFFLKRLKTIFLISVYTLFSITFAYSRDFISFYYLLGFFVNATGFYFIYHIMTLFNRLNRTR
jgi:hypothetical protein